jgi:predicted  nucleic acid-binding Zn-ribbon protein
MIDRHRLAEAMEELRRVDKEIADAGAKIDALRQRVSAEREAAKLEEENIIAWVRRPTAEYDRAMADVSACMVLERDR